MRNRWLIRGAALLLVACQQQSPATAERKPQRAGKPMDPLQPAAKITAAHGAVLRGNNDAAAEALGSVHDDWRRAVKLPDVHTRRSAPRRRGQRKR